MSSHDESGLRIDESPVGLAFWIHVTPRSHRPSLGGVHGDALRVAVAAPPVEGKANAACMRALAEGLGVRRDEVELDADARGRRKRVAVAGDPGVLAARLRALAARTDVR